MLPAAAGAARARPGRGLAGLPGPSAGRQAARAVAVAASSRVGVAGSGRADTRLERGVCPPRLAAASKRVVAVERDRQRDQRQEREPDDELDLEAPHLALKVSGGLPIPVVSLSVSLGGNMRLSWTHAATGALTAVVVAGLLLLPGRLLGPDTGAHDVVALATTAPRPVEAAPVAARKAPARQVTPQGTKPAAVTPATKHATTVTIVNGVTAPLHSTQAEGDDQADHPACAATASRRARGDRATADACVAARRHGRLDDHPRGADARRQPSLQRLSNSRLPQPPLSPSPARSQVRTFRALRQTGPGTSSATMRRADSSHHDCTRRLVASRRPRPLLPPVGTMRAWQARSSSARSR